MRKILSLSLTTLLVVSAFSVGLESVALNVSATEGANCKANYFLMNKDMSTYSLDKTENTTVSLNSEYSPTVYNYEGFISPKQKTVTADSDKTVNYFYERETYTIEYIAEGSDVVPESQKKIFGVDTKVTKIKPEKEGYTFLGWAESEEAQEIAYKSGDTISFEGDMKLYAVWSINTYIVSFDTNGGKPCDSLAYEYGSVYGELPVSEKSGYNFGGWYFDSELNNPVGIEDKLDSEGDKIFYAKWIDRKITSLSITTIPTKTSYFVGDTVSTAGLELSATYDNGETESVKDGYTLEYDELKSAGMYEVTVSYEGLSCTYNIDVANVELTTLEIKTLPEITSYYVDDSLNTKGMVVEIIYNNGKTKIISDYISEYDFSVAGQSEVKVSYTEYGITVFDSFTVTVIEKPEIYSEQISAEKGDTIAVPVYIRNNGGLMGYHIKLSYDINAFKPASTEVSENFAAGMYNDNIGVESQGALSAVWTGTDVVTQDGLMFTAYFEVQDVASDEYEIALSYEESDTITEDYSEVKLACTNTKVAVSNDTYTVIPTLYADDVNAEAGQTVQLPIYIKNGAELDNIGVVISFDKNIMKPLQAVSEIGNTSFVADEQTVFVSMENVEITTTDELLVTLEFELSSEISGSYDIDISSDFAIADIVKMNVQSAESTPTARLYADEISVGEHLVTVPICIAENSGIMGYKVNVTFDNELLSLTSVACGSDYSSGMFTYSEADGVVSVIWNNTENVSDSGVLFTLNFEKVDATACDTLLGITYSQDDTFNENWESVAFDCNDIELNLSNAGKLCGDVNSDELINLKDVILLKRYFAGGYDVSINVKNADINKDNAVDIVDIMILERYLDGNFADVQKWFE